MENEWLKMILAIEDFISFSTIRLTVEAVDTIKQFGIILLDIADVRCKAIKELWTLSDDPSKKPYIEPPELSKDRKMVTLHLVTRNPTAV